MPPRDPRECPALERALPASIPGGSEYRRAGVIATVLFGDGSWRDVLVKAWLRDDRGRWVMQIEWSAGAERWTETYVYVAGKVREG
jgi:hypothetical protein